MTITYLAMALGGGLALGLLWGFFRDLFARGLIEGRCEDCRIRAVRRDLAKLQTYGRRV